MGETQALVAIMPWTFIVQIGNLFIQAYLIKRFLFKPVAAIIEKRKNLVGRELDQARREQEKVAELKAEYEARIAGARDRVSSMLENARREAEAMSRETITAAREEAGRMREQAEKEIAGQRHAAEMQLRQEIGSLAVGIASRVVEREMQEEDHRRLIREFIDNVGAAS